MSQPAANDEHELRTASEAIQRGMTPPEIATVLYGEPAVFGEWHADSVVRVRTRRLVDKPRQRMLDEHPGPVDRR